MNHRATHLICSNAYGDKYRYALTFRLNVIRSSWVMDAWRRKNESGFSAKAENFTADHRLKIFEGCRIAFIGFPEHEKANMVSLLRSYNGVETASDDESCTHKVSRRNRDEVVKDILSVTNSIGRVQKQSKFQY